MSLSSVTATALSGLRAAQVRMAVTADNIANQQTPTFQRGRTVLAANALREGVGTGVHVTEIAREPQRADVARDLVELTLASQHFRSNLAVLRTSDDLLAELFSLPRR